MFFSFEVLQKYFKPVTLCVMTRRAVGAKDIRTPLSSQVLPRRTGQHCCRLMRH
jgi:hypothetical protein